MSEIDDIINHIAKAAEIQIKSSSKKCLGGQEEAVKKAFVEASASVWDVTFQRLKRSGNIGGE